MRFAQMLTLVVAGIAVSTKVSSQDLPPFVEQLIAEYEAASEGGPLHEIWKYEYKGETVFYLPLSRLCCDIPSVLYDADGEVICMPDGGFTGNGDGRCPDFVALRSKGVRVWGTALPAGDAEP